MPTGVGRGGCRRGAWEDRRNLAEDGCDRCADRLDTAAELDRLAGDQVELVGAGKHRRGGGGG